VNRNTAPTLVNHGTGDLIPLDSSKEWGVLLPGARLLVIEGSGHYPHLEFPEEEGLPLPAAGVALSPWTDLKCTGDSYRTNAKRDISTLGSWEVWGGYYAGSNDPSHPWISPLYGDQHGLPPILIEVGDHEILLDDARRFAEKARSAGVDITLHVWEGMVHCFPLFAPMFPEATQAWEEIIAYIKNHLRVD